MQGCRLPKGGGKIAKGAMPWSHRHIGNPFFTFLVKSWFSSPVNDVYCGMRAFTRSFYDSIKMKCTGMEFATEMIIKAANFSTKTVEIPITLHKDGRIQHPPHLRTIRDGLKTLQFFLVCAPSKLFLLPGLFMCSLGSIGSALGYLGSSFGPITLGPHTMLGSSLFIISGTQAIFMNILSLDISKKIGMRKPVNNTLKQYLKIPQGMTCLLLLFSGVYLWGKIYLSWYLNNFGPLDYASTMKVVILGTTFISLSLQIIIFNFFRAWIKVEINN